LRRIKVVYLSQSESPHDYRFISALRTNFEIREIFLDKQINNSYPLELGEASIIVATPLSNGITAIAKEIEIPIIGICMAFEINEEAKIRDNKMQIKKNIDRCGGIICDSKYIEDALRHEYQYLGRLFRIPYGCDQEEFKKIEFLYSRKIRIITTRNWTALHSNETILEAAEILTVRNIEFELLMLGDGVNLADAKKRVEENLPAMKVNFGGYYKQGELVTYFRNSEIYVSASTSDGSSVSLLEALSAGRICICRDFPSNAEWIQHGVNGFLFSDANNLANILEEISKMSATNREEISSKARASVLDVANWERNKNSFLNFVENVARK
jgi:glycosyltransferase involved in cell wall biosynthesis